MVFVTHNTAEALLLGTRLIVLARESKEDACGSRVTLDMKLAQGGMTLRSHGQEFLDLVEHVEAVLWPGADGTGFSQGRSQA